VFQQMAQLKLRFRGIDSYLCDDDLFYPEAFESFWNFYLSRNREPQAMYSRRILAWWIRTAKRSSSGTGLLIGQLVDSATARGWIVRSIISNFAIQRLSSTEWNKSIKPESTTPKTSEMRRMLMAFSWNKSVL